MNGDKCPWKHEEPIKPEAKPNAVAQGARVMTCNPVSYKVPYHHRVLVDSGANELIRPYNHQWWIDIMYGKGNGQKVNMKLAGNVTRATAMNQFGEVMIKDSRPKGQYDIGWILPVSRLQDELVMTIAYR